LRKSIALLVTLFFILSISVVVSYILEIQKRSFELLETSKDITQLQALSLDVKKIIKKIPQINDINDSENLANFLDSFSQIPLPISDDLIANIEISSAANKININSYPKWTAKQKELFLNYLQNRYQLSQAQFFLDIIQDLTTNKKNYYPLTSILNDNPKFGESGIYGFDEFMMAIDYYIKNSLDYNILNIPWKKIITFSEDEIDLNQMDRELWFLFLPSRSEDDIKNLKNRIYKNIKDIELDDEEKKILKSFNVKAFVPKIDIEIKIKNQKIKLEYDISKKKILSYKFIT